jgi:hypothetical protein
MRNRLAKLGYTASCVEKLDADKDMWFILIDNELDKIRSEEQKKSQAKRGRK